MTHEDYWLNTQKFFYTYWNFRLGEHFVLFLLFLGRNRNPLTLCNKKALHHLLPRYINLKNGAKNNQIFFILQKLIDHEEYINWENIQYQCQQEIINKATSQGKETGDIHIPLHIIRQPMNFLVSFIWHCPKHLL